MFHDHAHPPRPERDCGTPKFGLGAAPIAPPALVRDMTCAKLRDWVMGAQCNAMLGYARGYALSACCTEQLRDLVQQLNSEGYLTAHLMRDPDGSVLYVVRRSGRPVKPAARL